MNLEVRTIRVPVFSQQQREIAVRVTRCDGHQYQAYIVVPTHEIDPASRRDVTLRVPIL